MRVRWATDAADDLERICDYIAETSPISARRVAQAVVEGVGSLDTFPHRGRPGRVEGTRELVFVRLPSLRSTKFMKKYRSCGFCTVRSSGLRGSLPSQNIVGGQLVRWLE